jgi:hypothetical protein
MAKSHAARSVSGLVASDKDLADKYFQSLPSPPSHSAGGWKPKWPAKWKAYRAELVVHPHEQAVALVLTESGMLAELGSIECSVVPADTAAAIASTMKPKASQPTLSKWFGASSSGGAQQPGELHGFFSRAPLNAVSISVLERSLDRQPNLISVTHRDDTDSEGTAIAQAIEASKQALDLNNDDDMLKAVLASSIDIESSCHQENHRPDEGVLCSNDRKQGKWTCDHCTFQNMAAALSCKMCGFGLPVNGATAFDVVDLVESSQENSAPADDSQCGADGAGNGHKRTDLLPPQRNFKKEAGGGDHMTPAEARAACIEARLKRFEK